MIPPWLLFLIFTGLTIMFFLNSLNKLAKAYKLSLINIPLLKVKIKWYVQNNLPTSYRMLF